ncbi:MAG: hypothetical protein WBA17_10815, partial [Saprospiraceae bacterium]
LKGLYIYRKFSIHPLHYSLLFPLLIGLACGILFYYMVLPFHPIINTGIRSGIVGLSFLVYVWFTPYLPELKDGLVKLYKRVL